MEPPPEICRSPRKHPRSEQEDEEAGYDSDDGPCFDAIDNEGVQDFDEDDEIALSAPAATAANQEMTVQSVIGQFINIEESVLKKMKVNELKQALLVRGKNGNGKKADLLVRLRQALEEGAVVVAEPAPDPNERAKELVGFAETAYWDTLEHAPEPVAEPENTFLVCAPTVPALKATVIPVKYNFEQTFDCPVFTAKAKVPVLNYRGGPWLDVSRKTIIYKEEVRLRGCPNPDFIHANKLTMSSHPIQWFKALHPDVSVWTTNGQKEKGSVVTV